MIPSRDEILAVMARIAAAELELRAPLEPGQRLTGDLELDSMGLTIMAVGLENHFRIKLDEARTALREGIEHARRVGNAHAAGEMSEFLASLGRTL